ncbi:MAG: hypothetical protein ACE37H_08540 [Phycisphaeraceae bacterium]
MSTRRRGLPIRPAWPVMAVLTVAFFCAIAGAHPGHPTDTGQAFQSRDRDRGPSLLTDEDIALIEVYEVDLKTDPPPRIDIPKNVLEDFLKEFQEDDRVPRGKEAQDEFLRADGVEQLSLLFTVRARDYYGKVRIKSPIKSLRDWSNLHRRYLMGYFQPAFGEGAVKGLYLFGPEFGKGRDRQRLEMTNFYILTQVQIDGKALIDRKAPEESLLLQWGLPREEAKFPAPDAQGWRPYFKDTEDRRFVEMVEWIESLISVNQGSDYAIEYRIPGQRRESGPEDN